MGLRDEDLSWNTLNMLLLFSQPFLTPTGFITAFVSCFVSVMYTYSFLRAVHNAIKTAKQAHDWDAQQHCTEKKIREGSYM